MFNLYNVLAIFSLTSGGEVSRSLPIASPLVAGGANPVYNTRDEAIQSLPSPRPFQTSLETGEPALTAVPNDCPFSPRSDEKQVSVLHKSAFPPSETHGMGRKMGPMTGPEPLQFDRRSTKQPMNGKF